VAEVCARHGISRASFYRYRRRYREEGIAGLRPRSRRPRSSPARIEPSLEARIVELRRRHPRWGARRIHAELGRAGIKPPAVATIHRALRRNHLVAPQPQRRLKATRRFEREAANDLWQIDGTQLKLADGEAAWVVDCLDDHARFLLAAIACESPTGEAAWSCFVRASSAYGLPRQLLSDNHSSFTGRLLGITVEFERKLAEAGVELINAAPAHPQTLGQARALPPHPQGVARRRRTRRRLEHLQLLLDRFRSHYNEERPHQGIGNETPAQRYLPGRTPGAPLDELAPTQREKTPPYPPYSITRKVWANGVVGYQRLAINVGRRYRGATVRLLEVGELVHVYLGEELIHIAALDRGRRYQRLGKKRRP
jgi:transposase InsO family protein